MAVQTTPYSDDAVRKKIDRILKKNEKEIREIYIAAGVLLKALLDEYLKQYKEQDDRRRQEWKDGKIKEQDYLQWRIATIIMTKRWLKTRGRITSELVDAATKARHTTIGYMPEVFRVAKNQSLVDIALQTADMMGVDVETTTIGKGRIIKRTVTRSSPLANGLSPFPTKLTVGSSISFDLVDEHTALRLFTTKDRIYHMMGNKKYAEVQAGLRTPWEKQKVQSALLTSILMGEDVGQIAQRIADTVTVDNMSEAIRDARTMTTGAESAGRVDSYIEAEEKGIIMKQVWLATIGDGRTREAHLKLHHQKVDVGEPFRVDGDEIRFPGDPTAPGYLVYNCRCAIAGEVVGFR